MMGIPMGIKPTKGIQFTSDELKNAMQTLQLTNKAQIMRY